MRRKTTRHASSHATSRGRNDQRPRASGRDENGRFASDEREPVRGYRDDEDYGRSSRSQGRTRDDDDGFRHSHSGRGTQDDDRNFSPQRRGGHVRDDEGRFINDDRSYGRNAGGYDDDYRSYGRSAGYDDDVRSRRESRSGDYDDESRQSRGRGGFGAYDDEGERSPYPARWMGEGQRDDGYGQSSGRGRR